MRLKAYKNIKRLHQIITVLIKYGFGGLVKEMKLFPYLAPLERLLFFKKKRFKQEITIPERIRMVLEELGPTFVKLGQVASTRADLLPPDWVNEIKKLQDMVPPFSGEEAKNVLRKSLKAPIHTVFSNFDEIPIASASIAQVHFATLIDGSKVAVKVKRPNIGKIIDADMSVMRTVAELLEKYVPLSRRYRPKEVVSEFSKVIKKEQDFEIEGFNADRFHKIFENDPSIQIPKVYWDYTTSDVLTMERVSGVPIDEAETIRGRGLNLEKIAENGIRIFFKQVFEHGIFHADLHPGNIFVRDDGVLIYLDFGIVGRLDRKLRKYLASMLFYLMKEDYYRMALMHREMDLISKEVDLDEFEDALREIVEPMYGRTLEKIDIPGLLMKLIDTARRFQMSLQPNLLLLQKSMVIIEGVGRQLYPDINMWEIAKPLIYKWMMKEKASPKRLYDKGRTSVDDFMELARDIPHQMHSIMNMAIEGDIKVGFVHHKLDHLEGQINQLGQRIALGLIISSLVIGSSLSMIFASADASRVIGIPVLGLVGFVLAFVLGIRLCFTFKGGRKGAG